MRYDELISRMITRRAELHLAQWELGDLTGIMQTSISNFERGRITMTVKSMLALLGGLDMRLTVDGRDVNTCGDMMAAINRARLTQRRRLEDVLAECGYSSTAFYSWSNREIGNVRAPRVLDVMTALKLDVKIREVKQCRSIAHNGEH